MNLLIKTVSAVTLLALSSITSAEPIGGFEFGGVFAEHRNHFDVSKEEDLLPHIYSIHEGIKFFDNAQIGTDENKRIREITLLKSYRFSSSSYEADKAHLLADYNRILTKLESKYGEFDNSNAPGSNWRNPTIFTSIGISQGAINQNPSSKKVGEIKLIVKRSGSERYDLSIVYMDSDLVRSYAEQKDLELSEL